MSDERSALLRLISGFQASRAIGVAAELGLADALGRGPASATELARRTGTHPDPLQRLLQLLAAIGLLAPAGGDRFALTPMGDYLRSDARGSCAAMAELFGRPGIWQAWGDLLHTVKTGETAFDHVHGCSVWQYRARHPGEAAIFDRAMASGSRPFAQAVLEICDFSRFGHVVDVGGGDGVFLATILERHPALHGTVFDQPEVIARAAPPQPREAFQGRYRALAGDFFESVPGGGDAYLLKWILHDWSDTACVAILQSCRRAMALGGRLLVAEYVLGPGFASPEGELMDLTMMVMNGGRERSLDTFASLFAAAGFRLTSATRTATPLCLIECEIADDRA